MLPRAYRLPASQFAAVKSRGQLFQSPLFGILVSFTPSGVEGPRFGFIVSTKISSQAVVRNRLRRLLREGLRPLLPSISPGHDFIILAKHQALIAHLNQISHTFHEILVPYLN
jgi:ribonuclease P protein component